MIGRLRATMITMDHDGNVVDHSVFAIKIPVFMSSRKAVRRIKDNPARMECYLNMNSLKDNILLSNFKTEYNEKTLCITYNVRDIATLALGKGMLILG